MKKEKLGKIKYEVIDDHWEGYYEYHYTNKKEAERKYKELIRKEHEPILNHVREVLK